MIRFCLLSRNLEKNSGHGVRMLLICGVCLVFYNEYLIYLLQSARWPDMHHDRNDSVVKLLFVADPQILGERSEKPPLRRVLNWDSDDYLRKTYRRAVAELSPDAVVFLGDIMDEGTVASPEEFRRYFRRLSHIFPTEYPVKHVWLPGDNDIGGENEPVYPRKIEQFLESFSQPDVIEVKSVDVYKLNLITKEYPKLPEEVSLASNRTRIVVSHMPVLPSPGPFAESFLRKTRPQVIFSAHKHSAYHLETRSEKSLATRMTAITPHDRDPVIRVNLGDRFHEFVVPTCSYRMGVPDMGYGVAIIDKNTLQFSVFWSPRRFEQLKYYLMYLFVVFVFFFIKLCLSFKNYSTYTIIKNGYAKV